MEANNVEERKPSPNNRERQQNEQELAAKKAQREARIKFIYSADVSNMTDYPQELLDAIDCEEWAILRDCTDDVHNKDRWKALDRLQLLDFYIKRRREVFRIFPFVKKLYQNERFLNETAPFVRNRIVDVLYIPISICYIYINGLRDLFSGPWQYIR